MQNSETQLHYLHRQIDERLKGLTSSVQYYRRRHWWRQMVAVLLSATITVVAGIKSAPILEKEIASNIVLILGACSTVWNVMSAHFAPKESWHLNAEIRGNLRSLKARLEFEERSPDFQLRQDDVVKQGFADYQKILADYNTKWVHLRSNAK